MHRGCSTTTTQALVATLLLAAACETEPFAPGWGPNGALDQPVTEDPTATAAAGADAPATGTPGEPTTVGGDATGSPAPANPAPETPGTEPAGMPGDTPSESPGAEQPGSDAPTGEGPSEEPPPPPEEPSTPECAMDADCADPLACTDESCVDGMCMTDDSGCECLTAQDCASDSPCAVASCSPQRACEYDESACGCLSDADCDDESPGTVDSCDLDTGECTVHAVTYSEDIQAILFDKCTPCHEGPDDCSGGACLATSYAVLTQPSEECSGMTVAECSRARIEDGSMPRMRGCSGDPEADADNPDCLTATEHDLLRAWLAGGTPE